MPQKICPRCGAQYPNLKSATCPQCFGKLDEIDDETAAALTAARAEVEETDEFRRAKAEEDEQYRFESFKACFMVVLIGIVTLVVSVVMVVVGSHRARTSGRAHPVVVAAGVTPDLLTPLPRENASIDEVLPVTVGAFRRIASDERTNLSGTLTAIYRGHYISGPSTVDVFAIPQDRPPSETTTFSNLLDVVADIAPGKPRAEAQFKTEYWRYGVLAGTGGGGAVEAFREALGRRMTPN